MALLPGHKENFETLRQAFLAGDVALLECQSASNGETVAVLCAANRQNGDVDFVPFATLFNGNPYEEINPPKPEGGFFSQDEIWGKDGKELPSG